MVSHQHRGKADLEALDTCLIAVPRFNHTESILPALVKRTFMLILAIMDYIRRSTPNGWDVDTDILRYIGSV